VHRSSNLPSLIVLVGLIVVQPHVSEAQTLSNRRVVLIAQVDQPMIQEVIRAVEAQLSDLPVLLEIQWAEGHDEDLRIQVDHAAAVSRDRSAVAVFWCYRQVEESGTEDRLVIFLGHPGGDRVLVRKLNGTETTGLAEAVAIIVRSTIGAVLGGDEVGVEVARVAEWVPGEREDRQTSNSRLLALHASYTLASHSKSHPAIHGLGLGLDFRIHGWLLFTGGYTILGMMEEDGQSASVKIRRHPVHLGLRVEFPVKNLRLGGSMCLTIDSATVEVYDLAPHMVATPAEVEVVFGLLPVLRFGVLIQNRLYPFVAVGAQVPFNARTYIVQGPSGREMLIDSWPLQPWVKAGLSVSLF